MVTSGCGGRDKWSCNVQAGLTEWWVAGLELGARGQQGVRDRANGQQWEVSDGSQMGLQFMGTGDWHGS